MLDFAEKMQMREWMAKEVNERLNKEQAHLTPGARHLLKLAEHYSETSAAAFLNLNLSSMRRKREDGTFKPGIHYIDLGPRGIRYVGYQLADILLFGIRGIAWANIASDPSPVASGSLPSEKASGTAAGTITQPDRQSVTALAQKTFGKQKTA